MARRRQTAGKGADVEAIREIYPELVERESWLLGTALRHVVDALPQGGRALVVGHSPTNEAAVLGLTGRAMPPLGKGEGILFHIPSWLPSSLFANQTSRHVAERAPSVAVTSSAASALRPGCLA